MGRDEGIRLLQEAITDDKPGRIKDAYKYYNVDYKTKIWRMNQLECSCDCSAISCIHFLLDNYHFNVTDKVIELALDNNINLDTISFLLNHCENESSKIDFIKRYYYRNKCYDGLLKFTKYFDLSFDYLELKVLGLQFYGDLVSKGAKYTNDDYIHYFLFTIEHDSDYFKKLIDTTGIWRYRNRSGNIIHIVKKIFVQYKDIYEYSDYAFNYFVTFLFKYYDIDPMEEGYDGKTCCCYLKNDDESIYERFIKTGKASAYNLIYPRIYQNLDLDVLFDMGLKVDTNYNGYSLYEYAIISEKFWSAANLYTIVPGATPFYGGKHIIELAFRNKDDSAVQRLFELGLGYNHEEYYQITSFKLFDAYLFINYNVYFGTRCKSENFGLIIQDFIMNYNAQNANIVKSELKNIFKKEFSLSEDDKKYKFLEIYFQHPLITHVLPLDYLIGHEASVKIGNPFHYMIVNRGKIDSFEYNVETIIKYGLIKEKVEMDCILLDSMFEHFNDGSIGPDLFIKTFQNLKKKIENFSIKEYDDRIKLLNVWNSNNKICTLENYNFLKSIGAQGYNIMEIASFFNTKILIKYMLLDEILQSFVDNNKRLPKLDINKNYLILAAQSKSFLCKIPNVIKNLIKLEAYSKSVDNDLIFTFIDQFVLSTEIYQTMIDNGINTDVKTKEGETPLIYLLKNWGICDQRYYVAEIFLKAGVSKKAKDHKGWTALSVAKMEKDSKMINLLR